MSQVRRPPKREHEPGGLACYPAGGTVDGVQGDYILLASSYIITPDEIDMAVDRLGAAIDDALSSLPHRELRS